MAVFGRVLTAMITPMHPDGRVDLAGAARLAKHLLAHGSDGLVVCGTTGESPTLSDEEKLALFQAVLEATDKSAPVIAGTGSNSTHHSVELTEQAVKLGVDGVMAVVPYYNKPPQEGLFQHFKAVAEACDCPVMLYNVPSRTGGNLLPETVARLAEIPNVAAVKEASGSLEQVAAVRRLTPPTFTIYSGDDALTLPVMSVGGSGVVSVAAHVVGDELAAMVNAFAEGRTAEAARLNARLLPVFKALFCTTNPIPVKYACRQLGLPAGPFRLPMVEPSEAEQRLIDEAIAQMRVA